MKIAKYFLFGWLFALLIVFGVAGIRDETGTTRYRRNAILTFDPTVTITDEDNNAWSINYSKMSILATVAASPSVQTFASNSNAVTVAVGGSSFLLQSANPVSLTNCTGATAGYIASSDITVSNSSGAAYTNFCTIPNAIYVGANGVNQATNAVTIAATKQAFWHVETRGTQRTNVWVTVEQ